MGGKSGGSISAQEFLDSGGTADGVSRKAKAPENDQVSTGTITKTSDGGFTGVTKSGSTASGDFRGELSRTASTTAGREVEPAAMPPGWLPSDKISMFAGRPFNSSLYWRTEMSTASNNNMGSFGPTAFNAQKVAAVAPRNAWATAPKKK